MASVRDRVSAHASSAAKAIARRPPIARVPPDSSMPDCTISSRGAFSSMTTKRKSTMMAPAYTMI